MQENKVTFTKEQLVNSKKYQNNKDVLNALLKDNKTYSITDVDAIIEKFMKGKVSK